MGTPTALSIPAFLPTEIRRPLWSGLVCLLRDVRQNWKCPTASGTFEGLQRGTWRHFDFTPEEYLPRLRFGL
jgi:hypothetical protein